MKTCATNILDDVKRWASINRVPAPWGWVRAARASGGNHSVYEIAIYRLLGLLGSCTIWIEDFSRPLTMDAAGAFVEEILRTQDFRVLIPDREPLNSDALRKYGLKQVGKVKGALGIFPPAVFLSTNE